MRPDLKSIYTILRLILYIQDLVTTPMCSAITVIMLKKRAYLMGDEIVSSNFSRPIEKDKQSSIQQLHFVSLLATRLFSWLTEKMFCL